MDEVKKLIKAFAEKVARAADTAYWGEDNEHAERFYAAITVAADDLFRALED